MNKRIIVVVENGEVQGIASDYPDLFEDVEIAIVDYGEKALVVNSEEYNHQVQVNYTHVMQASIPLDEIFERPDEAQEKPSGLN